MNGKTVYVDWKPILGRPLAEAFQEDEDGWSLFFIKSGIVAHDDVVQYDVDVWNFMAVEWCDEGICRCIEVPLGYHQLNDITDLNRLFLVWSELVVQLALRILWLIIIAAVHLDLQCRRASTLYSHVVLLL